MNEGWYVVGPYDDRRVDLSIVISYDCNRSVLKRARISRADSIITFGDS